MCVAAAIIGGATAASSALQYKGAKGAAKAQAAAANAANANSLAAQDAAIAEQRRQYDTTRNDFAPYRNIGVGALNNLAKVSGIGMPGTAATGPSGGTFDAAMYLANNPDVAADPWASANPMEHWNRYGKNEGRASPLSPVIPGTPATAGTPGGASDMSPFFNSPDYGFRRSEGQRDIGNSFAARGGAFSGNALKALTEFNSNLAAGEFGNWWNRQAGLVDAGQGGTAQTANAGANMANSITNTIGNTAANVGNNLIGAGNARASGVQGQYNALADGIGFAGGLAASYYGGNRRPKNNLYGWGNGAYGT